MDGWKDKKITEKNIWMVGRIKNMKKNRWMVKNI